MEEVKYDLIKITKKLSKYLDEDRLWHTLGVMNMAAALAMVHQVDVEKAKLAGILHDCAKCIPTKKKIKICKENDIKVTEFELEHPVLLHAKVGVWIAQEKYDVQDEEILQAISYHTTGSDFMSELDKIIYIADYIEPARNKAPRLFQIRELAFQDLDLCMYEILHDSVEYLNNNPSDMDDTTLRAYEYFKKLISQRRNEQ